MASSGRVSVQASPSCARSRLNMVWYSKVSPASRVTEMRCVKSSGSSETVSLRGAGEEVRVRARVRVRAKGGWG